MFSTKNRVREVKLGSLKTATALHPCSTTAVCRALLRIHLDYGVAATPNAVKVASVEETRHCRMECSSTYRNFAQLLEHDLMGAFVALNGIFGMTHEGALFVEGDGDHPPRTRTCVISGSRIGS